MHNKHLKILLSKMISSKKVQLDLSYRKKLDAGFIGRWFLISTINSDSTLTLISVASGGLIESVPSANII